MDEGLELRDEPEGPQVILDGRPLYGSPPGSSVERRIRNLQVEPGTIVLWASPLVWLGLETLITILPEGCSIIGVEADDRLYALAQRSLSEHPESRGRVTLCRADPNDVLKAYRAESQSSFRRVLEVTTAASARFSRELYAAIADTIRRDLERFWRNRITLAALGRLWLSNLSSNLPYLATGIRLPSLKGPAIICGAGPSLDRAIPELRRNRSRATIIAVDTALTALEAHGIPPDYVIALDGQIANLYDFAGTHPLSMACDLTAHPATHDRGEAVAYCMTEFAPFSLLDRVATLDPGILRLPPLGSVGIVAVHLALRAGASPVVLSGLDFAVLPGQTHARGSSPQRTAHLRSNRLRPVHDPAIGGRVVRRTFQGREMTTTAVLLGYADALSEELASQDNVYVLERTGLPLGVPELRATDLRGLLANRRDTPQSTEVRGPSTRELTAFLEHEIELIQAFSPKDPSTHAAVDYLFSLAPDAITSLTDRVGLDRRRLTNDAPLAARLEAARHYMLDRWSTSLHRVLQMESATRRPT